MTSRAIRLMASLAAICLVSADAPSKSVEADKAALKPLQAYVGGWKGVGLPKRGVAAGGWTEECDWAWRYAGRHAELAARSTGGKYFSQMVLKPGDKTGQYVLLVTPAEGKTAVRYTGAINDSDHLVVTADEPQPGQPSRITMRMVAGGDRLITLYETGSGGSFTRLGEVGATRKGAEFAKGSGYPECVVTGGRGTIKIDYKGETYYVCCTGCRDLFNDDPEGVLADYRERKVKPKQSQ